MSYQSPIELIYDPKPPMMELIKDAHEDMVLQACINAGCRVDKDELVKALAYDRDQYRKGYADGRRDANAANWISVEEKLPEYSNQVLVLLKKDGHHAGADLLEYWGNCCEACPPEERGWGQLPKGVAVTHWMPLPPPPWKEVAE